MLIKVMYWLVAENVMTRVSREPNCIAPRGNASIFTNPMFNTALENITTANNGNSIIYFQLSIAILTTSFSTLWDFSLFRYPLVRQNYSFILFSQIFDCFSTIYHKCSSFSYDFTVPPVYISSVYMCTVGEFFCVLLQFMYWNLHSNEMVLRWGFGK